MLEGRAAAKYMRKVPNAQLPTMLFSLTISNNEYVSASTSRYMSHRNVPMVGCMHAELNALSVP